MNEHVRPPKVPRTTQGAEGLPRWRWSLEQFDRLIEVGILTEDDRVELIDGEIVPMAAKGNRHDLVKDEIVSFLVRNTPKTLRVSTESGWSPSADLYYEPDVRVAPKSAQPRATPAADLLLLIEVVDTSLDYDLDRKAKLYAALGAKEYWVIEAWSLTIHVHTGPSASGYGHVAAVAPTAVVTPSLLPSVALSMAALDINGT